MNHPSASAVLLLACLSLPVPVMAASYAFETPLAPQLPYVDAKFVAGPSFVDLWSFTAPAAAGAVTGTVTSLTNPALNIDALKIELYTGTDRLVASGAAGEMSELDSVPLQAGGAYYFRVSGDVVGAPSGFYTFSSVASPVPEPASGLLLLTGAGFALVSARRAARRA